MNAIKPPPSKAVEPRNSHSSNSFSPPSKAVEQLKTTKCMASVTKQKTTKQCSLKRKPGFDFCSRHITKKLYHKELLNELKNASIREYDIDLIELNNEINKYILQEDLQKLSNRNRHLNDNFHHNLLCLYSSWDEIPLQNQILLDNEYWEIDIIINHMVYQLNNSNMENSYPVYPNNPFNRKIFNIDSLMQLKNRIMSLNKPIHISLKTLLSLSQNNLNKIYEEALESPSNFSSILLQIFQKELRFMIINKKNSQDSYTGIWVPKHHPKTQFEIMHKRLNDTPYQIIYNGYVVDNYLRPQIEKMMETHKEQDYNISKQFCEYIR